jgi:YidC/Oxa1 family membrane protein insertase
MGLWTAFVDLIHTVLLSLAVAFGGNMALAIAVLSVSFRLALLPLTLRMAFRSLQMQALLKKIEPELSRIKKKYKDNPSRVWEETAKVHQREGIHVLGRGSLLGMLVQMPFFVGLFSAVRRGLSGSGRFLWIKDLMKSDPMLACFCAVLTAVSSMLTANSEQQRAITAALLSGVVTLLFLWRLSAGVTIYTFGSGLVGLLQSMIVRRRLKRVPA